MARGACCACCRLLAAGALFIGIAFTSLRSLGVYSALRAERREKERERETCTRADSVFRQVAREPSLRRSSQLFPATFLHLPAFVFPRYFPVRNTSCIPFTSSSPIFFLSSSLPSLAPSCLPDVAVFIIKSIKRALYRLKIHQRSFISWRKRYRTAISSNFDCCYPVMTLQGRKKRSEGEIERGKTKTETRASLQ